MRGSKQSANVNGSTKVTVVRTRTSSPATGGLCDCLRIPRRVRPLPFKSKEQEMVETRPGRLIRVIHLLPNKRNLRLKYESHEINGNNPSNCHNLQQREKTKIIPESSRVVVHADAEDKLKNCNGEKSEFISNSHKQNKNEDLTSLNGEDDIKFQFSSIYGFENPFHPKNYLYTEQDEAIKTNNYAEQLAATILDDAMLELGTLWRLISPSYLEDKMDENGSGRDFYIDDDLEDINYKTWTSYTGGYQLNGSLNLEKSISKNNIHNDRDRGTCNGMDNPTFEMLGFEEVNGVDIDGLPLPMTNGHSYSSFTNYKYPPSSSTLHSRSSFTCGESYGRVNNQKILSRSASSRPKSTEDNENDQCFRIYHRPLADEVSSLPSTSFQSSIWGSSANSSLRYVRRYASRRFKTKPLLCFIHGIGDSAELWNNQLKFFQEKGYETVSWDLIGHGLSSAPNKSKAYTFDVIMTDVLVLFDRYSRDRNIIVGHSYGCCFAAALARLRSKQVAHLIMISGGGPFPLYPHPPKMCLPSCLLNCFRSFKSCGTKREMFYVPYRKQMRPLTGFDIPSYVIKHMIQGQFWLEGDASFHKQITIPTLLIYGLKDPYVNLVEECEMEKTIPRAFLELVPEASHMVMLETPDQVNDMMYKFLRRWNG